MNIFSYSICEPHSPTVVLASTDVVSRLFDWLFTWVGNFSSSTFHFPIKALLLFLVPYLLCALFMRRHPPTLFSQAILCVIGILIVGAIPVDHIAIANTMTKTWLWIACMSALVFLPGLLAGVLVPTVGAQRRLSLVLYAILGILFLLNIFLPGGQ